MSKVLQSMPDGKRENSETAQLTIRYEFRFINEVFLKFIFYYKIKYIFQALDIELPAVQLNGAKAATEQQNMQPVVALEKLSIDEQVKQIIIEQMKLNDYCVIVINN